MLQMQKTTYPADNCTATRARANVGGLCARVISLLICVLSIVSCQPDIPMVNLGIGESYAIERMRTLILHPEVPGESYTCYLASSPIAYSQSPDSLIATTRDLIFCTTDTGTYVIRLNIIDQQNPVTHSFKVVVWEEQVAYSPYISKVLEYNPAPGQFINKLPTYEEDDTYETMRQKAEEAIAGTNRGTISLGAWGGYVTFAFDHSVVNLPGKRDFVVHGNAFQSASHAAGGSSEPGIVMVSIDRNQNGLPDDPFYQLRGSEYDHPQTIHHYSMTYHKASGDIPWSDNQGYTGTVHKNTFHSQSYFPQWLRDTTLTFYGSCLPDNAEDLSGNGSYYLLRFYGDGYVDCNPNDGLPTDTTQLCAMDIAWAVDDQGKAVDLPCIDFVRVYTGVNQECGWIGETSTEISHARDLHIKE